MKIAIVHTAEVSEMPKSCAVCPFNMTDVCNVAPTTKDGMSITAAARKKRARNCPIEIVE